MESPNQLLRYPGRFCEIPKATKNLGKKRTLNFDDVMKVAGNLGHSKLFDKSLAGGVV